MPSQHFSGFASLSLPGWPDLGSELSRSWPRQPANFYFVLKVSRDTLLFLVTIHKSAAPHELSEKLC